MKLYCSIKMNHTCGILYSSVLLVKLQHCYFCLVSLENVLLDVRELQRGMDLTRREYSMHGHNSLLKDFIQHNESRLKKLQDDARISQVETKLSLLGTD